MTQPNAEPVAPQNTPAPTEPAKEITPTPPFDPKDLSPEAQAYLRDQIAAADKKSRTTSKENAAAEERAKLLAEFAEKLGLAPEQKASPEELAAQIEQAQAQAWKSATENQMLRIGSRLGIDADALLDSNRAMDAFADALDEYKGGEIGELDPSSAEFAREVERALGVVAEKYPHLKASRVPKPDPSQGARGTGPAGLDAQIAEAEKAGNVRLSTRLKLQQAAQKQKK